MAHHSTAGLCRNLYCECATADAKPIVPSLSIHNNTSLIDRRRHQHRPSTATSTTAKGSTTSLKMSTDRSDRSNRPTVQESASASASASSLSKTMTTATTKIQRNVSPASASTSSSLKQRLIQEGRKIVQLALKPSSECSSTYYFSREQHLFDLVSNFLVRYKHLHLSPSCLLAIRDAN